MGVRPFGGKGSMRRKRTKTSVSFGCPVCSITWVSRTDGHPCVVLLTACKSVIKAKIQSRDLPS